MKITTKKTLLASAILFSLNMGTAHASQLCGSKTLDRQGEVPLNQMQCISDYGHYLFINVPYENSQVTISTSGGTFSGSDADIILFDGNDWSGNEEQSSKTSGTNDESITFTSRAGERYFRISGNIEQTNLMVTVSGGDIPPPMGDYIVFDTDIQVSLPAPTITSKAGYGSTIATILAASYSDFEAIASASVDPITDVAQALHYLASTNNLTDPDLNQILYFLGSYKYYAADMTDAEAAELSIALQAVAKMNGFLGEGGAVIQEGYAKALNNFERKAGAAYFKDHLPHLLAAIQSHSLSTNPFSVSNAGDSTMALLGAIGSAAYYGDASVKSSINTNMLDVLSVLRSFAFLGETSLDMRWSTEADRKWILPHTMIALGKVASIATDEAKARFDSTVLEVHSKVTKDISVETTEKIITKNYLESAGRLCESTDPLFGSCVVPPKEEDILTVSHACNDKITIRAQSTISQATLDQSCADMALQETEFHAFFNTNGIPVTGDKNDTIEVIAFASPADYEKYAPEFFGISTDNGGMYLEGTPESDTNQARFIAMQCPDDWVGGSCQYIDQIYNLRHEFVHYLDGRYVKAGSYGSFDYNVSWSEGMAEYMANGNDHPRTLNTLKGKTIPPLYNLLFMAYGYDELYPWSYFAMRYLAEEHPTEVENLTAALQAGDNTAYIELIKGVAERTQSGFETFVLANSEAVAPKSAQTPPAHTIGSCDLVQQYARPVDANATNFTFTNTTNTPVSLFWLDNNKGTPNFGKNYKTLNQGDTYSSSSWKVSDRMVLTDNNMNCLGVAVMGENTNTFTIEADLVKDVISEVIPSQDELGSCALAQPHMILDKSHAFTITNTSDKSVRLFRVDNATGKPKYESAATGFDHGYGTLAKGESYTSDIWYGDRRFMVTDTRLNCLSVGVLDNSSANFTIDDLIVANAAEPEVIPAANTIGSCDLMEKHLTGPFEADFSFTNTSSTPVRVYRVDNETGQLSEGFGFTTLQQGETYDSANSWKWFGKRRAAITDTLGQCLGVAVMTEKDTINTYDITDELTGGTTPKDTDGDGVIDSQDAFPNDPNEWADTDGDGYGDNSDAFVNDPTEWLDTDGDGYGDNSDAFPTDATEWVDTDGDGMGDNSDPYPEDPTNTAPHCGEATISYGQLHSGITQCISGGRSSFYVWIENDNTQLTVSTDGGDGDADIHFNADTWATAANAQAKSSKVGNNESFTVTAHKGWRYIDASTTSNYSGVSITVTMN